MRDPIKYNYSCLCRRSRTARLKLDSFAAGHMERELRPLYVVTGSAIPSPRSGTSNASAIDNSSGMNFLPCSPSSVPLTPPSPSTPPTFSASNVPNIGWIQPMLEHRISLEMIFSPAT